MSLRSSPTFGVKESASCELIVEHQVHLVELHPVPVVDAFDGFIDREHQITLPTPL